MRWSALVCAFGLVLLAGCGVQPSGVIRGASPPSGPVEPSTATTLHFVSDGRLVAVRRPGPPLARADVLALLAAGPTEQERARGLGSEVPPEAAPFSATPRSSGRMLVTTAVPTARLSGTAVEQIACTAAATDPGGTTRVELLGAGSARTTGHCPG
ncbi:hypothetical protein [Saccharopolyspora cebuensis]|uniref:Sporulation and spore germination n=1 Tax=Saccharopolyspora cebuensis TaxID=418759 RepID=A0ABV4CBB7_9PSEU